jgi:hypothetical protein
MGFPFGGTPQIELKDLITLCERNVNDILSHFDSINPISLQDEEIIKLYIDQIETGKNILILLQNNRVYKINSMIRSLIEQFVYVAAVMSDKELANRYFMYKAISYGESVYNLGKYKKNEVIVEDYGVQFGDLELSIKRETLIELIKQYNSLFPEKTTNKMWYNLDGKTTTIEKLVKKLNMDKGIAIEYAHLSRDTHSNTNTIQASHIIAEKRYCNITFNNHLLDAQERVSILLIDTYKKIMEYYKMPCVDFEYSQAQPEILKMFKDMIDQSMDEISEA